MVRQPQLLAATVSFTKRWVEFPVMLCLGGPYPLPAASLVLFQDGAFGTGGGVVVCDPTTHYSKGLTAFSSPVRILLVLYRTTCTPPPHTQNKIYKRPAQDICCKTQDAHKTGTKTLRNQMSRYRCWESLGKRSWWSPRHASFYILVVTRLSTRLRCGPGSKT